VEIFSREKQPVSTPPPFLCRKAHISANVPLAGGGFCFWQGALSAWRASKALSARSARSARSAKLGACGEGLPSWCYTHRLVATSSYSLCPHSWLITGRCRPTCARGGATPVSGPCRFIGTTPDLRCQSTGSAPGQRIHRPPIQRLALESRQLSHREAHRYIAEEITPPFQYRGGNIPDSGWRSAVKTPAGQWVWHRRQDPRCLFYSK
jgi:hypothetical protein